MMQVRDISHEDWPAVAAEFEDQSFEQSLAYGLAAAARIGGQARFVVIERDGAIVAVACVRTKLVPGLGCGIAWIASGPLTRRKGSPPPDLVSLTAILAALRNEICRGQGHLLRLRLPAQAFHAPETVAQAMAAAGFRPTPRSAAYHSVAIDLHKDETLVLADLDTHWRRNLRSAQKANLSLDQGDDPALQARFLTLYDTVRAAKGFDVDIPPEFHFALQGPDYHREILIATKDGVDLAGSVIGTVGATAVYLFGATTDAGRPLRTGYFLHWQAIGLARARGLSWYDLGGIDAEANPDVTRFKEGLNGVPLSAAAYEADAGGPVPVLIRGLESLRARLRRKAA